MSILTLADARSRVREIIRDEDSTSYAIATTLIDAHLQRAYAAVKAADESRVRYITATSSLLTLNAGEKTKVISASVGLRKCLDIFEGATVNSTVASAVLERVEPWDITARQVGASNAQPTHYSVTRDAKGTVATAAGQWLVQFYPPSDITRYYCIRALVEPAQLVNTTDTFDVDDAHAYVIVDMASALIAKMQGMDTAYVEAIERRIPEVHRNSLNLLDRERLSRGPM